MITFSITSSSQSNDYFPITAKTVIITVIITLSNHYYPTLESYRDYVTLCTPTKSLCPPTGEILPTGLWILKYNV